MLERRRRAAERGRASTRSSMKPRRRSRRRAGRRERDRTSRPDFSRDLDRFGEFLALVGLISLVVGGVGVANAAQGFVERKRATLAILKALGASGGAVVALALIEFLAAALIGVGAGTGDRRGDALRRRGAVRRRPAVAAGAGDLSARARARRALWPADGARLRRRAAGARPRRAGVAIVPRSRRDPRRRGRAVAISLAAALGGAALAGAGDPRQSAAQRRDRRRRRDGARRLSRCGWSRSAAMALARRAPRPRVRSPGAWRSPICTGPAR